jgi:hypothetical protein
LAGLGAFLMGLSLWLHEKPHLGAVRVRRHGQCIGVEPLRRESLRESVNLAIWQCFDIAINAPSDSLPLADVLPAANDLVRAGLIEEWALGGALAAIYYVQARA